MSRSLSTAAARAGSSLLDGRQAVVTSRAATRKHLIGITLAQSLELPEGADRMSGQEEEKVRFRSATFVIVTAIAFLTLAHPSAQEPAINRAFPSGGTVVLDLSAGDYRITGSRDNRIRVEWRTDDPDDDARVQVRTDVKALRATVLTDGPVKGFDVRIELPQKSNLVARLSAGELDIRGIEGDKDVTARAGDINIEVGDRDRYRRVNAS